MSNPFPPREYNTAAVAAAPAPDACPACRSAKIVTTAKIADANSYWRCETCGEIWTPSRRGSPQQRRWSR